MEMTLSKLAQATWRAAELKTLRASLAALREDRSLVITVRVNDLTQTYGMDRRHIAFSYAREKLLALMVDEETRLVLELRAHGVNADEAK